ncbi:uncharacterized protein C8Q71DRAFT_721376 [Rhodofomes roseus]|uniref:Uncharacterized protein n=1 Tax=Rhodofomes roseus TaxID=34475 RepID=A0ABQ8KRC2_9APHY|nr:uncharacterized protein C8Q71DRAFT_721376 [Rhodofomes roseus]KAH9840942.1 hypothetical protein C8Q71DRAFT_721376 [Rhodofomes roseus]
MATLRDAQERARGCVTMCTAAVAVVVFDLSVHSSTMLKVALVPWRTITSESVESMRSVQDRTNDRTFPDILSTQLSTTDISASHRLDVPLMRAALEVLLRFVCGRGIVFQMGMPHAAAACELKCEDRDDRSESGRTRRGTPCVLAWYGFAGVGRKSEMYRRRRELVISDPERLLRWALEPRGDNLAMHSSEPAWRRSARRPRIQSRDGLGTVSLKSPDEHAPSMNRASQIGTGTPCLLWAIGTTLVATIRPIWSRRDCPRLLREHSTCLRTFQVSLPSMAPNSTSRELCVPMATNDTSTSRELRQGRLEALNRSWQAPCEGVPRAQLSERVIATEDRLQEKEAECRYLFHMVIHISEQSRKLGLTGALE